MFIGNSRWGDIASLLVEKGLVGPTINIEGSTKVTWFEVARSKKRRRRFL